MSSGNLTMYIESHKIESEGYVYLLFNNRIPDYVKIGYTNRTPKERASELRGTGIPGVWVVSHYWNIPNPLYWEKRIHEALRDFRIEREFFHLSIDDAKSFIHQFLVSNRIVGEDGLTEKQREIQNERLRSLAKKIEAEKLKKELESVKRLWDGHRELQWKASKREAHDILMDEGFEFNKPPPVAPIEPAEEVFSFSALNLSGMIKIIFMAFVAWIILKALNIDSGYFILAVILFVFIVATPFVIPFLKVVDPVKLERYNLAKKKYEEEFSAFNKEQALYKQKFDELLRQIYPIRHGHFLKSKGECLPEDDNVLQTGDVLIEWISESE